MSTTQQDFNVALANWQTPCYARLADVAISAESEGYFYRDSLFCISEELHAHHSIIHVRCGASVSEFKWTSQYVPEEFFSDAAQTILTAAMASGKPRLERYADFEGHELCALVAPIRAENITGCLVSFVVVPPGRFRSILAEFVEITSFFAELMMVSDLPQIEPGTNESNATNDAYQQAAKYDTSTGLAYAITNRLKTRFGAEQVALGRVRGKRVRIVSLSSVDEVKAHAPGVALVRQAMEECLDRGEPIVCQSERDILDSEGDRGFRLHKRWQDLTGAGAVASIPLGTGGGIDYVLSLRRAGSQSFERDEINEVAGLVTPYCGALALLERAQRGLGRHVLSSAGKFLEHWFRSGGVGRRLVAVAAVALAVWIGFGAIDYEVTIHCSIQPLESRAVGVPVRARLERVTVVPGDHVEAGEVLCEFDTTELDLEIEQLEAELEGAELDVRKALAASYYVGVKVGEANVDKLRAQLDVKRHRKEMARVIAPFTGHITSGNLRERVGEILEVEQPLFQLARDGGWRIDLEVDESSIVEFEVRRSGRFIPLARPEKSYDIAITRILPAAIAAERRTYYVVEAESGTLPTWSRPGMQGLAKVDLGERPVWWLISHRAIDWVRLHAWW